jgi:hypothetical protein
LPQASHQRSEIACFFSQSYHAIALAACRTSRASGFYALAALDAGEFLTPCQEAYLTFAQLRLRFASAVLKLTTTQDLRPQPGCTAANLGNHCFQHRAEINRFTQGFGAHQAEDQRAARNHLERSGEAHDWLLTRSYRRAQFLALTIDFSDMHLRQLNFGFRLLYPRSHSRRRAGSSVCRRGCAPRLNFQPVAACARFDQSTLSLAQRVYRLGCALVGCILCESREKGKPEHKPRKNWS